VSGDRQAAGLLIDRDEERSAFDRIVQEAESVRLLTIRAGKRMGKSRLLEWLDEQCRQTFGVPAGHVEFKTLKDKTRYGVAEHLVTQLTDFGLSFPYFEELDLARADEDFSLFRPRSAQRGEVATEGMSMSGGFVANEVGTVVQEGGQATVVQPRKNWTGQHEEKARDRCANAFLNDLRELAGDQRVLLLFDAYEHCPPPLRQWIEARLLLQHALTEPPTRLTVVLAGPPDCVPDLRRGRERLVLSLNPKLSVWDDSHVAKYLEMRGVPPNPVDVEFVARGLREKGWTFDDLESAVELVKPRGG
jgi:hypothetical protein